MTKYTKRPGARSNRNHSKARKTTVRLNREVTKAREEEARAFFKKNPEATGTALNAAFKAKGQPMMNIAKVYKLRGEVRANIAQGKTPGVTEAAQPVAATGTDAVPSIPQVEFENARRIAGRGAAKNGAVLPFDRVTAEAQRLWAIMQATGCSAVTIVEGKLHLTGKFQTSLALS